MRAVDFGKNSGFLDGDGNITDFFWRTISIDRLIHKSVIHKSVIHKSVIHKSVIHKSVIHIGHLFLGLFLPAASILLLGSIKLRIGS
jgi:hypothetical protein